MLEELWGKLYDKITLSYYKNLFREPESGYTSLSLLEGSCQEVIYLLGKPTVSQFALFCRMSLPNATYRVNSLVKKGYLQKESSQKDKRETHLLVTEKFMKYYCINDRYMDQVEQGIRERFSSDELAQLDRMLRVIVEEIL